MQTKPQHAVKLEDGVEGIEIPGEGEGKIIQKRE